MKIARQQIAKREKENGLPAFVLKLRHRDILDMV